MATATVASDLAKLLADGENTIIKGWMESLQRNSDARISAQEVEAQARDLLRSLTRAAASGSIDIDSAAYQEVRDILEGFSRSRALQGFSPSETATFVFSLKQPLFERIRTRSKNAEAVAEQTGR